LANFIKNGANQWRHGEQFDTLAMHDSEQRLTVGVDEIHFAKVKDSLAALGRGGGGLPALFELANPQPGQATFQIQAKFVSAIV
jgi:hypothetical protein